MDFNRLAVFAEVAENGSFSEAARRLACSKTAVSRAISALEDTLGTQLIHRDGRRVVLTDSGRAPFHDCAPLLASLRDALHQAPDTDAALRGTVRITAPSDMSALFVADAIAAFAAAHPQVKIDFHVTNRRVDLIAERFDLALRVFSGAERDSALIARKAGDIPFHVYASPAYLEKHGTPRTIADIRAHDWVAIQGAKDEEHYGIEPGRYKIICDDFLTIHAAVRAGAGLGFLPDFVCHADVQRGLLSRVVPSFRFRPDTLMLLRPPSQRVPRRVLAMRDFLLTYIRERNVLATA